MTSIARIPGVVNNLSGGLLLLDSTVKHALATLGFFANLLGFLFGYTNLFVACGR